MQLTIPQITDIIVGIFLMGFIINGWRKGLFRTLLGPLALILGTIGAYYYYGKTHNILISFAIAILGPLVLTFFLSFNLNLWNKTVDRDEKLTMGSHILGSAFSLFWGGGIFMFSFILLILIPGEMIGLGGFQKEIKKSYAYSLVAKNLIEKIPQFGKMGNTLEAISDPDAQPSGKFSQNLEALRQDERMQEILKDEALMKQIENKDISKVMTNPKILAIAQDEELVKKFFALYQQAPQDLGYSNPGSLKVSEQTSNPETESP